MKLAYIITAYIDAKHLLRLIKSLDPCADFYCHIDKKANIQPFETLLASLKNVYFAKNRFFVNWGSYAQVLSQKELISMVLESKKEYDRVVCLSGLDYPLYSNRQISELFEMNPLKEYLCGVNVSNPINKKFQNRVVLYHFFRDIKLGNTFLKKCFSGPSRLIMKALPIRKKNRVYLDGKLSNVYMGSDYWALTYPCIKYVFNTMLTEKYMMNYFKYSFVPSEMCIQTIVFNSKFANYAQRFEVYQGLPPLTPLHYIVYNKVIKIFNENDFETLKVCGKMFFRKAVSGKSDKLIERVEAYKLIQDNNNLQINFIEKSKNTFN